MEDLKKEPNDLLELKYTVFEIKNVLDELKYKLAKSKGKSKSLL